MEATMMKKIKVDESKALEAAHKKNEDKCLLCYGPHTTSLEDKGPSFELKNLKDIFTRSFGIQFLPHFSQSGRRVHMCSKCNEEFLKVQSVYDEFVEIEKRFDGLREKFAFIIVDSIFKSDYISNYVHGNAFDSFRYLVFKEWSEKFKKQAENLKKLSQNQQQPVNGQQKQESANAAEHAAPTTKQPSQKTNNNSSCDGKDDEINNSHKQSPLKTIVTESAVTSNSRVKTPTDEKQQNSSPDEPLMPKKEVDLLTKSARSVTGSKSPAIEDNKKEVEDSLQPTAAALSQKRRVPSGGEKEKKKIVNNSMTKSVRTSLSGVPSNKSNTIVLSPDGQLISASGSKLPTNHKVIFVKKDPLTGKMVRVEAPLNGNAVNLINDQLTAKLNVEKTSSPSSSAKPVEEEEEEEEKTARMSKNSESNTEEGKVVEDTNKSLPIQKTTPQQQQYPYGKPPEKKQVKVVPRPRNIPLTTGGEPAAAAGGSSRSCPKIVSVKSVAKPNSNNTIIKDIKAAPEQKKEVQPTPVVTGEEQADKSPPATKKAAETTASNGTKQSPSELKPPTNDPKKEEEEEEEGNEEPPPAVQVKEDKITPKLKDPPKSTEPVNPPEKLNTPVKVVATAAPPPPPVVSPESRSGRRRIMKRVFDASSWASGPEMDKLVSQYVKGGLKTKNSPKRVRTDPRQKSVEPECSAEVKVSDEPKL